MKRYSLIAYTFVVYSAILADSAALTTQTPTSSAIANTATLPTPAGLVRQDSHYDITQACVTNPRIGKTTPDSKGKQAYSQVMLNRTLKHTLPKAAHDCLKHGNLSVLHGKPTDYKNYPSGNVLFPHHPELNTAFSSLIDTFKQNQEFIKFFRKIHLNALNELYDYLMKIYANFNLQHIGSSTINNRIVVDVQAYLQDEAKYATSKKTLIINHLVNIIEAQFNGAIRALMKGVPALLATHTGKTMIQSDFSVDLSYYILQQEEPILLNMQNSYLKLFGQYLSFFEGYTSYLQVPHATIPDLSEFTTVAQNIQQFLGTDENAIIAKMDPPMFFFDADTFRALKIIPKIAQSLPQPAQSISWPTTLIHSIQNKTLVPIQQGNMTFASHPIGYFRDQNGTIITDSAQAVGLYMVLEVGQNLYEQEILAEPAWMASVDGIISILRACLGDLHQLVGLNILDPITETVIAKSYNKAKNIPDKQTPVSLLAEQMLNMLQQSATTPSPAPSTTPSASTPTPVPAQPNLPDINTLPTLPDGSLPIMTPDLSDILPADVGTMPTPSLDNITGSLPMPDATNILGV